MLACCFSVDGIQGLEMKFKDWCETSLNFFAGRDFAELLDPQLANDLFDEGFIRRAFNHLHKLQRRLFQLDTLRRRFIERAVNDVRPVNEITQRFGIESKFGSRGVRDEFRARLPLWIEKLPA